ncbi:MAG: RluA family pseudouridine synthase [Rhodospirillales bacterium]
MARTHKVGRDEAGMRVDRWFKRRFPELGHGRLQKWLRTGQVRVDGGRVKAGTRLEEGQAVRVPPVAPPPAAARPRPPVRDADARELKARVLHRDADLIVIDKPPGLAVQGGNKVRRHLDAMLDALRFGATERPRLVHRLDKDTSGVLVLARHGTAARQLTQAFRSKDARKLYWAVVVGVPRPAEGTIDLALAKRGGPGRERVGTAPRDGKQAVTRYRVIDRAGRKAAWVAFEPLTGRTHQLRVHAAALGTPILGDGKYGGREAFLDADGIAPRLHLHARALRIPHPSGGLVDVAAPLPGHMHRTFGALGFDDRQEKELFSDIS